MVLVDIDPLKGPNTPNLFSEFNQWYREEITVSLPITFTKELFE